MQLEALYCAKKLSPHKTGAVKHHMSIERQETTVKAIPSKADDKCKSPLAGVTWALFSAPPVVALPASDEGCSGGLQIILASF